MFEHNPDFNRRDSTNGRQDPMPIAGIADWVRDSEPGKKLRMQVYDECSLYTSASSLDRMKAHIESLVSVTAPISGYEKALNFFDRESKRQKSARISLAEARTEIETSTSRNVEIIERIVPIIDRFVEEEFVYSPRLKSLLQQIDVILGFYKQRTEYWDSVDQEVTRLAGDGYTAALYHKLVPEHTRWRIDELLKDAREQYRQMCIEQLRMINEWGPVPGKFNDLHVLNKDGSLEVLIKLEGKDIVVAGRSALRVGDCFLNGWKYSSSEDSGIEEDLKYDRVIGTFIMLEAALKTAKKEVADQLRAVGNDILVGLLPK